MNSFKEVLTFHLNNFYAQDFLLLGLCFLFFIVILTLAIVFRRFPSFSVFLIIVGIFSEFALFFIGKDFIDTNYRPSELKLIKNYKMQYSNNIYLEFKLTNKSNYNFKICNINFRIQHPSKNKLELIKNYLKPIKVAKYNMKNIDKNDSQTATLIIPSSTKLYKIIASKTCY